MRTKAQKDWYLNTWRKLEDMASSGKREDSDCVSLSEFWTERVQTKNNEIQLIFVSWITLRRTLVLFSYLYNYSCTQITFRSSPWDDHRRPQPPQPHRDVINDLAAASICPCILILKDDKIALIPGRSVASAGGFEEFVDAMGRDLRRRWHVKEGQSAQEEQGQSQIHDKLAKRDPQILNLHPSFLALNIVSKCHLQRQSRRMKVNAGNRDGQFGTTCIPWSKTWYLASVQIVLI